MISGHEMAHTRIRQIAERRLIIASLLREIGETGVQTHIGAVRDFFKHIGVPVHVLTPFDAPKLFVFPILALRRPIERISGSLAVWWYRTFHSRLLRALLAGALSDKQRTVIYAQCPLSAWAALESRTARQRVVMAVHFNRSQALEWCEKGEISFGGRVFTAIHQLEKDVLPKLDGIVYVSRYMKDCLEEDIPSIINIPSAVIPNFSNTQESISSDKIGDLVSIGTLENRKNQCYLLHILASASKLGYTYSLALIGDGPERTTLENLACSLGIRDQVVFHGYREKAAALLPSYRMYVHSALRENLPVAIIEAMACGMPLAALPVGGIPEIFSDGIEGIYWPLDDPVESARRLISVMEVQSTFAGMAIAAMGRFRNHFATDKVASQLETFLFPDRGV